MSEFPLVSVLFVTYKRVHLLRRSLESFLANTSYPNLELVVTDDGSPGWMQEEISKLPFHRHILGKKRRGVGANSNEGLRHCTGDYILFLQDDWECQGPDSYLTHALNVMQADPSIGLVRFYGVDSTVNSSQRIDYPPLSCRRLLMPKELSSSNRFIYSDTPHLRSKLLDVQLGPYREDTSMETCEKDFGQRFLAQSRFSAVFFPDFNNRVFVHIGEAESFRTNSLRHRCEAALASIAKPFKGSRFYNAANRAYKKTVRTLIILRLIR
jgi:hypothetical protein